MQPCSAKQLCAAESRRPKPRRLHATHALSSTLKGTPRDRISRVSAAPGSVRAGRSQRVNDEPRAVSRCLAQLAITGRNQLLAGVPKNPLPATGFTPTNKHSNRISTCICQTKSALLASSIGSTAYSSRPDERARHCQSPTDLLREPSTRNWKERVLGK